MNIQISVMLFLSLVLSGCSQMFDKHVEWESVPPDHYPVLHAVGYAPISSQPGLDENTRMLQAIRASKLDAYRELAEQIYGQQVTAGSSMGGSELSEDRLQVAVSGVVRGARVIRTYPLGDLYATELELDMADVQRVYQSLNPPRRIHDVQYY
ncbi:MULTISPECIES: LPP20 family lipoprotein [Corallincola]|uniref:Flagellar biosynthesis protein FlgP n=3 Tax=Corallincola TaxID=1775176 RepID=A0A368N2A6_9GAMM|nr:flagellar biosynthesis protein FlgP [Corallincola holothuriorum]TAA40401.1 flagellar biosynthesis protein FlgP [Corallincola spongiicola]TCI05659.1 flagellar biosynthesis protein FlgP [Corallincola luteus]